MKRRSIKSVIYSGAGRLEAASSAALIFLAAFLKWDPAKQPLPVWLLGPATWLLTHGLYVIFALTLTSGFSKLVRQRMTRPALREDVHWMLDQLQLLVFQAEHRRGEPGHLHRVTLFRAQTRPLRRGLWLVPFARSGHTTQKTDTRFRIDDDPRKVEGIAGRAWMQGRRVVTVQGLPDLSSVQTPETQSAWIREYADKTFVSPEWIGKRVEQGKMAARSYTGIPVEVSGNLWGAIVIDSINRQAKWNPEHQRTCMLFTKLLEKRLERG